MTNYLCFSLRTKEVLNEEFAESTSEFENLNSANSWLRIV